MTHAQQKKELSSYTHLQRSDKSCLYMYTYLCVYIMCLWYVCGQCVNCGHMKEHEAVVLQSGEGIGTRFWCTCAGSNALLRVQCYVTTSARGGGPNCAQVIHDTVPQPPSLQEDSVVHCSQEVTLRIEDFHLWEWFLEQPWPWVREEALPPQGQHSQVRQAARVGAQAPRITVGHGLVMGSLPEIPLAHGAPYDGMPSLQFIWVGFLAWTVTGRW